MAAQSTVLLVTDVSSLSDATVTNATKTFEDKLAGAEGPTVITNIRQAEGKLAAETSSVDVVISLVGAPGFHDSDYFQEVARVLKPGGEFVVQEPAALEEKKTYAGLERSLLLAGFVNVEMVECVDGVTSSSDGPLLKPVAIKVKKPTWQTGAATPLRRKVPGQNGAVKLSFNDVTDDVFPVSKSPIKLDMGNDDDDLVDEDTLLTEEDLKAPEIPVADNCGVAKKACKNCSCGRAEIEAKQEEAGLTAAQISNPKSACGSCGLGDAFRCAGCPYRGMPTFKLGEKITLEGSLLVADA